MRNEQLTSSIINKNKIIYYKNEKKYKLIYKSDRVEVSTYYSGNKQKEKVQKVEIKIHKKNGILTRITKYIMNRRVSSTIENGLYTTIITYDKINGKKIILLEKYIKDNKEKKFQSKELHIFSYKNPEYVKEVIKYYGSFLKSGIGERIIKYDLKGNIISNKDNIEYYGEKLNKKLKYKVFPIFNEQLKNRYPKLPQETNEYTYGLNDIKKLLMKSINITLDNGSLLKEYYELNENYELPFIFASAVYNTLAKKNNAYIKMEIPEIFKDIDEKELLEKLDILSYYQRNQTDFLPINSIIKLKLDNKIFDITSIGKGWEGCVFRISRGNFKPVILKIYYAENIYSISLVSFASSGLYGSMAILREANLAKVEDIAKLYYANPIYTPVGFNEREIKYIGAWQICEDAETRTIRKDGLKFKDWLASHGLIWKDNNKRNWINNICIDYGFVETLKPQTFLNNGIGESEINLIYSRYINRETTRQILDFLNSK